MDALTHTAETYQGLEFHINPLYMAWQKLRPSHALAVASKSLHLRSRPAPLVVEDPAWVAIKPILSGICGSDLSIMRAQSSPYLAPLTSFPAVLGHEVVGEIDTLNAPWPRGTRVVIDPSLACAARGIRPCSACAKGEPDECANRHHPKLGPGMLLGYHQDIPGGWSTRMWVPRQQIYPIPTTMTARRAVLTEPSSIVWQALSRIQDDGGSPTTLILGGGTIGLLSIWLFKMLHPTAKVFARTRYPLQSRLASQLGADVVYQDQAGINLVTSLTLNPIAGEPLDTKFGGWPFRPRGFDIIIDTVGSETSFYQSATLVRPGGQILLLGGAGKMSVDLTPIWSRRVTLIGSFGYGHGPSSPATTTFNTVIKTLDETPKPIEQLVTHIVALNQYQEAIEILQRRQGAEPIKVAFGPPSLAT